MQQNNTKKIGMDLTQGPIVPQLIRFSIPFLLASLLQTLYNAVDLSVIGQVVGSSGTVAVSMGGKITNMVTMAGIAFSSAGQVYIGQLTGAKNKKDINDSIGNLFSLLFLASLVCAAFSMLADNWLVSIMNTPEEAVTEAYNYIFVCAFGFPFLFIYNGACSVLRGMGDSKNPLVFIGIASVANLILDIVFVAYMGMGSGGAALATAMGQAISAIFAVVYLFIRREHFGFDFKPSSFKLVKKHVIVIVRLGIPLTARQMLISISQLFVTSFVNAFGLAEAAAYGVGEKVYQMLNTVDQSFNTAGAAMIAQNIGAKKEDRVKGTVHALIGVGCAVATVVAILVLAFPRQVFALFSSDEAVLAYARSFCMVMAVNAYLSAMNGAFNGVVTGSGRGGLSLLGGILDSVVFRIGLCALFAYAMNLGVVGFYMGSNFAKIAPISIGLSFYLSGNWKKKLMVDDQKEEK